MRISRNDPDRDAIRDDQAAGTITSPAADRRADGVVDDRADRHTVGTTPTERHLDRDGDGRTDRLDRDGDGRVDALDRDHDGRPARLDRDGDGRVDALERDHDGRTDRLDRDGDGRVDQLERDHHGRGAHVDQLDRDGDGRVDSAEAAAVPATDRHSVVAREKERYGGVKIGSAFFGWLTATGTAVILTALLAAAGTTIGLATDTPVGDAAEGVAEPETIGVAGVVGLLVILFVSYYCGGYVAGRMARFNGIKQGIAVWVWAIIMAIVVVILAAVAGDEYDVLARLNGFPRLPVNEGDVTAAGAAAVFIVAATSLVGAIVGGLAGMRFHRAVDKAGLGR
jgi:hypothetical protein